MIRKKYGLSQSEVANLIGFSYKYVSDIERGVRYSERYFLMFMTMIHKNEQYELLDIMLQETPERLLKK